MSAITQAHIRQLAAAQTDACLAIDGTGQLLLAEHFARLGDGQRLLMLRGELVHAAGILGVDLSDIAEDDRPLAELAGQLNEAFALLFLQAEAG